MNKKLTTASFCAMTCAEGGFHVFLTERFAGIWPPCENKGQAAVIVTSHCRIRSRTELNEDGPAKDKWLDLQAEYKQWLQS